MKRRNARTSIITLVLVTIALIASVSVFLVILNKGKDKSNEFKQIKSYKQLEKIYNQRRKHFIKHYVKSNTNFTS